MTITRVSVGEGGNQANSGSRTPSISADGRFVAFTSFATNLVPSDSNNQGDIFVRDTLINTTTLISVDSERLINQANRFSDNPSISADGRFVAFESDANNLVWDTNNSADIFVRDTFTKTITRVSVDSAGNQAIGGSVSPSISADGRFVAFESAANNLVPGDTNNSTDIFVRDTIANTTILVSLDSAGNQTKFNSSSNPTISADGRFVAFQSDAFNLVPGDTNNRSDIFVRDLSTNTTTRVSVDSTGNQANGGSAEPSISADGRFVAFQSDAFNLVPENTPSGSDIFVRDRFTNATTLVSIGLGNEANDYSFSPSISADGRFVAFISRASNLVPGDTNNNNDIFVRDLLTSTTILVPIDSVDDRPIKRIGFAVPVNPSISGDGRFVAFSFVTVYPASGEFQNQSNVFVADLTSTLGVINGTPGNDNLLGTSASDTLNGFDGDDTIAGLRGNDILNGGDGDDILYGGKGFDTLNGGLGNDILVGGLGNDVFVLGARLGIDTISDFTKGQDTVQLINGLTFGQLSISAGVNGTLISVTSSGEVLAALTGVAPNAIDPGDFFSV